MSNNNTNNSWKQYGGTNHLENTRRGTIIADYFILRNAYNGDFTIHGNLYVGNITADTLSILNISITNADITGNITIGKDAFFDGNVYLYGNTFVEGNITFNSSLNTDADLGVGGNINVGNNITINGNIFIPPNYIISTTAGVGINTTPTATLDISGNNTQSLNVYSHNETTTNVIAQNINNRGIRITANTQTTSIQFYNDTSLTGAAAPPDSQIEYTLGGNLLIDTSDNTILASKISIIPNNLYQENIITQIHTPFAETATIYDISSGTYLESIYNNATEKTGNALTLLATDTSSNTFLNIYTQSPYKGISIGGGAYPNDQTRAMGTIGYNDLTTTTYYGAQTIVSGNNRIHNTMTTGINTMMPITENYALDINGETRIHNGDLRFITPPFCIYSMNSYAGNVIAIGGYILTASPPNKYFAYSSINGGETWNQYSLSQLGDIEQTTNLFNYVFYYNATIAFIVGENGFKGYTNNNGISWSIYTLTFNVSTLPFNATSFYAYEKDATHTRCFISYNDITAPTTPSFYFDVSTNRIYNNTLTTPINVTTTQIGSVVQIKAMTANSTVLYLLSDNVDSAGTYYLYNALLASPSSTNTLATYTSPSFEPRAIVAKDAFLAVGGANGIYASRNSGSTFNFTDTSPTIINTFAVYSTTQCVAFSTDGILYSTTDGGLTWNIITEDILNSAGTYGLLENSTMKTINSATFTDANTLLFNGYDISNTAVSNIYSLYSPLLFNTNNSHTLDVSGSIYVSGALRVNDGGFIDSNNESFYLLESPSDTIYFATHAPYVVIGNTSTNGMMSMYNNTRFYKNVTIDGNLTISGNSSITVDTSNSGITTFTNTTDATDLYTGAVIIYGGTSIAGNAVIGKYLTVYGNTYLNGNVFITGNTQQNNTTIGNAVIYNTLRVGTTDTSTPNYKLQITGNANITSTLSINGNLSVGKLMANYAVDVSGIINANGLYVNGAPYIGSQWTTTGADIYYITGNVGIGTATPQHRCHIVGNTIIQGNVGIGTTTPQYICDITGNTRTSGNMIITGTLSVGKSTANYTLDVSGIINANDLYVNGAPYIGSQWTSAGANIYYITGNVGIGTATPQYTCDISGNLRITSDGNPIIIGNIGAQLYGIDLGAGDGTRGNTNAGKIMYGPTTINANSLVIIGKSRAIDLFDNATINGNLTITNAIQAYTTKSINGTPYTGVVIQKTNPQDATFNLSLIDISNATSSKRTLGFNAYANAGANNGITRAGDHEIIYTDDITSGGLTNCGLTIAPYDTNISGMRFDSNGFIGICKDASTYATPLDIGKSSGGPSGIQTRTIQGLDGTTAQQILHIIQPVTTAGTSPSASNVGYNSTYNITSSNNYDISAGLSIGWSSQTFTNINTGTSDFLNWGNFYNGGFTFYTINQVKNFTPQILLYIDASNNKTSVNKFPNYTENTPYALAFDVSGSGRCVQDCSSMILKCFSRTSAQTSGTRLIFDTDGFVGSTPNSFSNTYISAIQTATTSASLNFATNNNVRMTIVNNGNIGIRTTSPSYSLDINGTINALAYYANGVLITNTNPWTIIDSTHIYYLYNVGIGKSTPANYALDISGTISTTEILSGNITSSGTITATNFSSTSDYRIKENPQKIDINIYNVDELNPVMYKNKRTNMYDFGLIAHEVQELFPFLVNGEKNNAEILQTVNYIGIIPILIKEIQILKRDKILFLYAFFFLFGFQCIINLYVITQKPL